MWTAATLPGATASSPRCASELTINVGTLHTGRQSTCEEAVRLACLRCASNNRYQLKSALLAIRTVPRDNDHIFLASAFHPQPGRYTLPGRVGNMSALRRVHVWHHAHADGKGLLSGVLDADRLSAVSHSCCIASHETRYRDLLSVLVVDTGRAGCARIRCVPGWIMLPNIFSSICHLTTAVI